MEAANEQYSALRPSPAETGNIVRPHELGVIEVACNTSPNVAGQVIGHVEGIGGAVDLDWAGFDS